MVIPDDEQREHLVREGEQTSRSGKALLQSHRATCGDVPRLAPRSWHYRETQNIPRHAKSAELVRTTVSDSEPGTPSPHVRGSANVISARRACQSPQSEAGRQNLAVAHAMTSPTSRRSTRITSSSWAASYRLAPVNFIMRESSFSFLSWLWKRCQCLAPKWQLVRDALKRSRPNEHKGKDIPRRKASASKSCVEELANFRVLPERTWLSSGFSL